MYVYALVALISNEMWFVWFHRNANRRLLKVASSKAENSRTDQMTQNRRLSLSQHWRVALPSLRILRLISLPTQSHTDISSSRAREFHWRWNFSRKDFQVHNHHATPLCSPHVSHDPFALLSHHHGFAIIIQQKIVFQAHTWLSKPIVRLSTLNIEMWMRREFYSWISLPISPIA